MVVSCGSENTSDSMFRVTPVWLSIVSDNTEACPKSTMPSRGFPA
jgi:hypothetical protein